MKRAAVLIFIIVACTAVFLSIKGTLPFLLLQSQPVTILVMVALVLLAMFLYREEIRRGRKKLYRKIFAPIIEEERCASWYLTRKIEATEQKVGLTEQALENFASAIAEYAQHLASHTSAIQGLSEASHELKVGAAEQNRVLRHLTGTVMKPSLNIEELTSRAKQAVSQIEGLTSKVRQQTPYAAKPAFHSKKLAFHWNKPDNKVEKPLQRKEETLDEVDEEQSPPGFAQIHPWQID